jgi:molybdate transport system permease protein
MDTLWPALCLSLRIGLAATGLTMIVAVPVAYVMARRRFVGKSVVEALLLTPLVLPPTVVGYLIITLLGARGAVGAYLHRAFDYSIIFRFEGAVLAAAVVAFPLLYMPAKAAFATVERELEDIARLSGASRLQLFWHVSIPLARRGLISGTLLAFGRSLGEFGATVMVYGWQPGRLTLPISIYADFEQGELRHAASAVIALSGLSLLLLFVYNQSSLGRQDN